MKLEQLCFQFHWKCHYCKKTVVMAAKNKSIRATRDHELPISRGGRNGSNVVLSCLPCNQEKGDMTGEEFRAYLKYRNEGYPKKDAARIAHSNTKNNTTKILRSARDGTSKWGYGW